MYPHHWFTRAFACYWLTVLVILDSFYTADFECLPRQLSGKLDGDMSGT